MDMSIARGGLEILIGTREEKRGRRGDMPR